MSETLNVIAFPGGFNLPIWSGIHCGAFARQQIDVRLHFTVNSTQQLAGLVRGDWEIELTGFDNIVAYMEGQGEVDVGQSPDLFAFMGGDNAFLRLVVARDVECYADLKGKTLAVDALTTGFAFVLRKMLALNDITEDEVYFERAGGALQRFEALKAGKHAGTLLVSPFELMAAPSGFRVLQNAADVFPNYQGIVGTARRSWASANSETLINSYAATLRLSPGFMTETTGRQLKTSFSGMCRAWVLIWPQPVTTFSRLKKMDSNAAHEFDMEGLKSVLALRSEYGHPKTQLSDVGKYIDVTYRQAAERP